MNVVAYRGIENLALSDLTPVTLILGANNSGKSSILEAIALLLRAPDPSQWVQLARQRDLDVPLEDALWSLFPGGAWMDLEAGYQESRTVELSATLGGVKREISAHGFASMSWSRTRQEEINLSIEVSVDGAQATLEFNRSAPAPWASGKVFKVFTATSAGHRSTGGFVEHLSHVVADGKKGLAVELAQLFDPEVKDLDVVDLSGRRSVRVTHKARGVVDLASFGDGLRRAVLFSLMLSRAGGGVLLIDELEVGIHPALMRDVYLRLCEAAQAAQAQLILTTHSLEAVDAILGAANDHSKQDALSAFWVQRKDGKHEVRRYDFAKLSMLREAGLDIR
jgi:hypothetical protein